MTEDCCPNCEALLHGRYCSDCGQRKPRPGDYSTLGVLGDAFIDAADPDILYVAAPIRGILKRVRRD
jgi:hypothetical protein